MRRVLAALILLCILLGTGIASTGTQPGPSPSQHGTRAAQDGMPVVSNITQNTTWDRSVYPFVHVRRNVWVKEGVILTILPGTVVKFEPGSGLYVRGGIIAEGAPFSNISFIPVSGTPSTNSWRGIALENSTGPCLFSHVSIRFSGFGIASWGAVSSISNSSIEYAYFFGILAGEDSTMRITRNFINFTTWVGIITGNRSDAVVESNWIRTSNHGIVCYDSAEIRDNFIQYCWLGILAWGDAHIYKNEVRDCRDGIHGFYASPLIDSNTITSCDGNGTRFIHSNAIFRNNRLSYNAVGMDIDYGSKHLLANMENNTVNGINIKDCFHVGKRDLVIEGLFIDSGWSRRYYGSLTAQGSVTLYDCHNVTIRKSTIINTVNSIFATNSTFRVYDTVLDNALRAQIYLEANATGAGFNRSVDPNSVMIGGDNCLFQTFDQLRVQVLDYHGAPIMGARVLVTESQLLLHDTFTDLEGRSPALVVKDSTVSEAGAIRSPLSVEVLADGYNFGQNPRTAVYVSDTNFLKFTDLGDIFPPSVLNISVREGDRAFPVNGTITIRFSEPMDSASVEGAFSITGNVTGTFAWEGCNMTFVPRSLEHGTYYTVVISTEARDMWNNSLESPVSFSFTTAQAPGAGGGAVLMAAIAIFALAGISGWLVLRKLRQ